MKYIFDSKLFYYLVNPVVALFSDYSLVILFFSFVLFCFFIKHGCFLFSFFLLSLLLHSKQNASFIIIIFFKSVAAS